MKNVRYLLLCLCCVVGLSSCSVTIPNVVNGHNYADYNLDLRLQNEEYRIVGDVYGKASAHYVFSIGGLSGKAKRVISSSYNDMIRRANLSSNQAIINVTIERRTSGVFYFLYARQEVITKGIIIEFIHGQERAHKSQEEVVVAQKTRSYSIGDVFVDYNGNKGVVFEISDNGLHGKAVSMSETASQWHAELSQDKWVVPNVDELKTLVSNRKSLNNKLLLEGGSPLKESKDYWTSTEMGEHSATTVGLFNGQIESSILPKSEKCCVRLVKYF